MLDQADDPATSTTWLEGDGTTVHIRSTNGRTADCFKAAIRCDSGQITANGRTWDVAFHEVTGEAALSQADATAAPSTASIHRRPPRQPRPACCHATGRPSQARTS